MAAKLENVRRDDNRVITTIRVPYADTDQMQHVYYANYLVYFEIARNEWMRAAGLTYRSFEEMGFFVPVAEAHLNYQGRVFYDDLIEISTTVSIIKHTRFQFSYEIRRVEEDKVLVQGHTVHAVTNAEGRTRRIPDVLVDLVASFENKNPS